ncbi:hypothetical protein ACWKSP_36590 [Micromonosporaceae bacterium Da 78-11]
MIRPTGYLISARRLGGIAVLAVALTVAGCGDPKPGSGTGTDGSTADRADAGGGSGLGPSIDMAFDFSGDVSVKGHSASMPAVNNGISPQTCAEYAKGGKEDDGEVKYVVPRDMNDQVDGKRLFVGAMVKNYTGPGTYQRKDQTDAGSPPGIDVDGKLYMIMTGSRSEITTDADGGGVWTFRDLDVQGGNGVKAGTMISGTLTWTCKD